MKATTTYDNIVCIIPFKNSKNHHAKLIYCTISINQSINQSCIFRVVQIIKSLQDPMEVGNNLSAVNNIRRYN